MYLEQHLKQYYALYLLYLEWPSQVQIVPKTRKINSVNNVGDIRNKDNYCSPTPLEFLPKNTYNDTMILKQRMQNAYQICLAIKEYVHSQRR